MPDALNVGGIDARNFCTLTQSQFLLIECSDDGSCQARFDELAFCIRIAEICENISAAAIKFDSVDYFKPAFNRRSLSRSTSMSCWGVLIPRLDFFWKA